MIEKRLPLFLEFLSAFRRYASYIQEIFFALLLILLLGAILIWKYENIEFGDALYFTCITGLTIGYGDITPETVIGRVVSVGIGLVGMLAVGLTVAIATVLNDWRCRRWVSDLTRERNKEWKTRFPAKRVCAEPAFAAEKRLDGDRFAVSSSRQKEKWRKNHHALDTGGGAMYKIGSDLGLERFQAQPIWEMSGNG